MSKISLSLACSLTDRTYPIQSGEVSPTGIDLTFLPLSVEEIFWRMLKYAEFDVSEMSMSSYMMTRDQKNPRFIAIPVFPSRFFRHSCVFVNAESNISDPTDLTDMRVGVPEYQMTSALWVRGILQDIYGVEPTDLDWYQGGEEDPGREEKLDLNIGEDLSIQNIPEDRTLSGMIADGSLDALVTARTPSTFDGNSVRRLFPNYAKVEREYYEETGNFPIMHTIVIRTELFEEDPWIAQELNKLFKEAKDICLSRIGDTTRLQNALPWLHREVERTTELMGEKYWPYGIEENRQTLETMVRYSHEQGLTNRRLNVDELFANNTHAEYKI